MSSQAGFLSLLLDSLDIQIAVLDAAGGIVYVNQAWVQFGADNGLDRELSWVGVNYLSVCHVSAGRADEDAGRAYAGISRVMRGEADSFSLEYPCHSQSERRWFLMQVMPLHGMAAKHFVISHVNITQRKLIEEQVESMSLVDQLTGLANRRHFERFLRQEWQRNMRERTPISLALFDLDHFKSYNDSFGHLAGDEYLRRVGAVLMNHARRPTDLAVRYGGEEFLLILGNTDLHGAEVATESVRRGIAGLRDELPGQDRVTTASAGLVCTIPEPGTAPDSLVERADHVLYLAKQAGRDRVVKHGCVLSRADQASLCRDRPCHPGKKAADAAHPE